MRWRLDVSYDGSSFHGWAQQPGLRTVQGELGNALAIALRTTPPHLTCAGRTDAGVHARGQVIHLDLEPGLVEGSTGRSQDAPPVALQRRLNGVLDPDLRVRRIAPAAPGFDARYSALWRRYAYRVCDDFSALDPLARHHVLNSSRSLDLDLMNQASTALIGQHDFASYCRRREGATTIRTLLELTWERSVEGWAVAAVRADAFCHGMVRALVGCLLAVGEGRESVSWAEQVLAAGRREPASTVAPAHGLTLEEVAYPPDADLAARVLLTRTKRLATR